MTLKVIFDFMKNLGLEKDASIKGFDKIRFKQKIYPRKHFIINFAICNLQRPLKSKFMLSKICSFMMLAFIQSFDDIRFKKEKIFEKNSF